MSSGQVIGDRWKIGKTLGRGSFATVKSGTDVTGQLRGSVAIKVFEDVEDEIDLEEIEQEITVMKSIDSEYCLKLYDVVVDEETGTIYVVMERAQAELTQRMEDSPTGKMTDAEAREYFKQLMEGLDYLHGHDIIHRDIKFENVMLDAKDRVKIGDFGMSKTATVKQQLATRCGSTRYISPEMALMQPGDSYDGRAMDIWSSGVLLFAMLTGTLPFPQEALGDMLKAIARGRYSIPGNVSPDARDLISKMMAVDARKRIKLDAIRAHPWLNPPKAPARPKRLEAARMQSVDAKQNRQDPQKQKSSGGGGGGAGKNGKRGSRKPSTTKTVLRGKKSASTSVDGLKISADMVRCIFGLFKKHYRGKVSWKAMKQDPEFEHYEDLLGEMENVRFEKLSDPEWKVSSSQSQLSCLTRGCCQQPVSSFSPFSESPPVAQAGCCGVLTSAVSSL
jgi:serine/threonine protein kinase